MIHYHGTPITPRSVLYDLAGRHFCCSYAARRDTETCHRIGQSVMLDNGAYTMWTKGTTIDWEAWAAWAEPWLDYPNTWAVAPDVIDGDETANDILLSRYGHWDKLVPVWHLHESLERLCRLVDGFGKVCFGSSGVYAVVGSNAWHRRVTDAFNMLHSVFGPRIPWIHMLRGMSLSGDIYPFASVDSTDIARNHNRPQNDAKKMAEWWDSIQCPGRWTPVHQLVMEET